MNLLEKELRKDHSIEVPALVRGRGGLHRGG
jgi:hypothetical protein